MPFAAVSAEPDPSTGPTLVRLMGVEKSGADRSVVMFCTDLGYWHEAQQKKPGVRADRAVVESFVTENVPTGDGEKHWLVDRHFDPDTDRRDRADAGRRPRRSAGLGAEPADRGVNRGAEPADRGVNRGRPITLAVS
ncbi:hypothetical protein [Actinoplanes sp. NPDC020271]|uniref:hypothetical protein n=1 Tax=Actinoplanes sp. NPDC020271 TaxID=3363896 RepID=UPI0037B530F1